MVGVGAAGCLFGGFVGFLLRSSAFMIGQRPFHHVITRGESLQGAKRVMISLARESFNVMFVGAVIGYFMGKESFVHVPRHHHVMKGGMRPPALP